MMPTVLHSVIAEYLDHYIVLVGGVDAAGDQLHGTMLCGRISDAVKTESFHLLVCPDDLPGPCIHAISCSPLCDAVGGAIPGVVI